MTTILLNPRSRTASTVGLFDTDDYDDLRSYFASRPDAVSTPLHHLPRLAHAIGLGDVLLKDETRRLGLNAFKVLGVSFAINRLLERGRLAPGGVVVAATSGNHGRAVAAAARQAGIAARIYVPAVTEAARRAAIIGEGATLVVVDGTYEDAVREAAREASEHGWVVVADTSWDGYEEIPRWIMLGYTQILEEACRQWGDRPPDIVFVQAGVGGLACAVTSWFVHRFGPDRPFIVVCEPTTTACALESARAGHPVTVTGSLRTVMSGLRCAEISPIVWPVLSGAVDAFVAIDDDVAESGMRALARPASGDPPVEAGASGASGVASLIAVMDGSLGEPLRTAAGLGRSSRALAICTEGPTDPVHYRRVTLEP